MALPVRPGVSLLQLTLPAVRQVAERRLQTISVGKDSLIISATARSTSVYTVLDGTVRVVLHSASGREVSIRRIGPGESFGELSALDGLPRSATVLAETASRLTVMSRQDYLACVESSPAAALFLATSLAREVRRLTDRLFELSVLSVQARLHCELLRLVREVGGGEVTPAPTHLELANRIGTHREAVTRELNELAARGVLRTGRRSIRVLDLPALEHAVLKAVGDTGTENG